MNRAEVMCLVCGALHMLFLGVCMATGTVNGVLMLCLFLLAMAGFYCGVSRSWGENESL